MSEFHTIFLAVLFALVQSNNDDLVNYYLNLIDSEFQRMETITQPTNSFADKPYTSEHIEYGTFDHIVIGAGSAGAIVASRLSEDPLRQVLLLEAGGEETNFTYIPAMGAACLSLEYNWNYFTVPQTTACLSNFERRCAYPRGKVLGGSSAINGAQYHRGSKHDYNKWCQLGNPGWCYPDVLPFFKKSETFHVNGDPGYHGYDGPVHVEFSEPINNQQRAFIEACRELKMPLVDYNGYRKEGVGRIQYNTHNGQRYSTGRAFLRPAATRNNLRISTHSHVTKILIDNQLKKAVGVVFAKNKQYYIARSRKDIILSAGTFGSPQLLMLSGIGPVAHLREIGIPLIQNLAVGRNLQDHLGIGIQYYINDFPIWIKSIQANVRDYVNGYGLLTDVGSKGVAFARTNLTTLDDYADIEIFPVETTSLDLQEIVRYRDETFRLAESRVNNTYFFGLIVILLHSESRGYIKLNSGDAFEYPIINPKMLSDSEDKDIETIYQGIQLALELGKTKAFMKLGIRLHEVHLPACKQYEYMSKDYWYCHIRQAGIPVYHPVGTCKMGPDPCRGAVVDHTLRVHGIKNLRIADASIMPLVPSGHTNAPTMMIGEKAAHMIMNGQ